MLLGKGPNVWRTVLLKDTDRGERAVGIAVQHVVCRLVIVFTHLVTGLQPAEEHAQECKSVQFFLH